jgi:hypothetical protein
MESLEIIWSLGFGYWDLFFASSHEPLGFPQIDERDRSPRDLR